MAYIKTHIGEHDYHKPACSEYCRMGGEFCPFLNEADDAHTVDELRNIVRWTDIADYVNGAVTGKSDTVGEIGYTAVFSVKTVEPPPDGEGPSASNIRAEYDTAGYTCWGDGSGFEYDQMSRNVMGPGGAMESIYDISRYGIEHKPLKFSEWNAWIDKFQYDYRFGRVSDTNAECILFPNVDNPWMFTEYVFKGIGGDSKLCAMSIPKEYVVEPPIYDANTLTLVNADHVIGNKQTDYDGKYRDEDSISLGESNGSVVKAYRKVINWGDLTRWSLSEAGGDMEVFASMNASSETLNSSDAGIMLYRARIPVQSVKWGEHGNIPPHTLDMTAPKEWFDPSASVVKMKAVYDAVTGSTINADYDGKIEWGNAVDENGGELAGQQGRQAYIYVGMTITPHVASSNGVQYIDYYSYSGGTKTASTVPKAMQNGVLTVLKPNTKIMPSSEYGEYCHGGCGNLIGLDGRLVCKLMRNGDMSNAGYFSIANCMHHGSYGGSGDACSTYVATREHPKIASYQDKRVAVDTVTSSYEKMKNAMMMATVGGLSGAMIGMSYLDFDYENLLSYYINLGKRGDIDVSYSVRYEPVTGGGMPAQLNKKKYNEFGKNVQIVPGTGKYALDSKENANPFSGGDTNAYDDINTLSFHRFFASVMHCASQRHCNEFTGESQKEGFDISHRAGGEGECRYYRSSTGSQIGCPHNSAPKRAIEFSHCSQAISRIVNVYMSMYNRWSSKYVFDLEAGVLPSTSVDDYRWETKNGRKWVVFGDYAVAMRSMNPENGCFVMMLSVKYDGGTGRNVDYSPEHGGAALIADSENLLDGHLLLCEYRCVIGETVEIEKEDEEKVTCNSYVAVDGFYWFMPLYNDGGRLSQPNASIPVDLRQHVDTDGYWFCKARLDSVIPTTNCMIVDNEDKFIGGWHPEYKDYSKIGSEFMQDVVSDESREGQGKGDTVHTGDYTPIPQAVNKKGYWIDQSGEYILDERDVGADEPIAREDEREDAGSGGAVCISFKKSNTEMDGETGEKKQPKVLKAALFSNDPYCYVVEELLGKGKPELEDPDSGSKYSASPQVNSRYLLPTLRHALHCQNCDYYIVWKYHDIARCPWCGSQFEVITGSDGKTYGTGGGSGGENGLGGGDTWDANASIMRKFPKIYSIGTADVWAPAGTALKTDAYFWRHQAQITNATRKQIAHRLGDANKTVTEVTVGSNGKESGGVYQFNRMRATSEMTLGYPEGLGYFTPVPQGAETDRRTGKKYGKSYIDWKPEQDASVDGMWNPVMPRHMVPEWYGKSDFGEEDEGVIAPYTNKSNDALKMVSYEQMRTLRNAIEPIYAYTSKDAYSGDYPTHRASYDQREVQNQPIIWQGRKSTISPQVLACVDKGGDSYQTYFSGDLVYGNVREYFPSGYTWWMANNTLGGRCTENKGGWYHMDDGGITGKGHMCGGSGGEYNTGTRTVAKCAMSIYGLVPLDKEIVAAYLIIRPGGANPSKNPVGRSWTGGPVMYCHYHALPKDHYGDGTSPHLHGTAGYPNDQYFDDDGNFVDPHPGVYYASDDIKYQDESAYRLWGESSHAISDDRGLYYEDRTKDIMTGIPCLHDTEFHRNVGTAKVSVLAYNGDDPIGMGYDGSSFGSVAGFTLYNLSNTDAKRVEKFQYIVVDDDGMVVSKFPESRVWKTDSTEQIEKTIRRHMATVELKVSDGTIENTKSYVFRQADSELYMNQMPRQSQAITGYFDMSWANTKGYVYDEYSVQKSTAGTKWDAPVIFQDGEQPVATANSALSVMYSGGGKGGLVGEVARCMPITDIVQEMWKNRIERTFSANAGCTVGELLAWKYYKPLNKGAMDDDVARQNDCFSYQSDGTYLLTDTVSYPKVDKGSEDAPTIDPDGDKYELAERSLELPFDFTFPFIIDDTNKNFSMTVGDRDVSGSVSTGEYKGVGDVSGIFRQIFSGSDVKVASANRIVVTIHDKLVIREVESDCYREFGIPLNGRSSVTIEPSQSRVVDVTAFEPGYSPDNLMGEGNGVWFFTAFDDTGTQSFTVDLLRAPLCKWERDWRYEEGTSDYSNVKCPSETCKAHTMGCSVAANMSNKYFNSSSPCCPICGASLEGQPGAVNVPGDGILTYGYDAPFADNPFITKIVVKPHPSFNTSYRVMVRGEGHSGWRSVLDVEYKLIGDDADDSQGYGYVENYPNYGRVVGNGASEITLQAGTVRGRFVKVECDGVQLYDFNSFEVTRSTLGSTYQVVAHGDFSTLRRQDLAGTKLLVSDEPFGSGSNAPSMADIEASADAYDIISTQIMGDKFDSMRVSLNKPVPWTGEGGRKYICFYALKRVGGISQFEVYGFHYKEEASDDAENSNGSGGKYLTVTGMEDEFEWRISARSSVYSMPEPPTQIIEVSAGRNGSAGIYLFSANSVSELRWVTVEKKLNIQEEVEDGVTDTVQLSYKRIISGNYYYDALHGRIYLPTKDGSGALWSDFEKTLRNHNVMETYMPNTLVMRYWSGNGKSITLKAKADGHGPSYMVEKNAIQKIHPDTLFNLPYNGLSCQMINIDGGTAGANHLPIPWVCYNNKPATLSIEQQSRSNSVQGTVSWNAGEFRKPTFTGKEIRDKLDDDQAFVDLFGPHCENCFGQCETEITLTGAPNQIVSGKLKFVAEPITKRSVYVGGSTVKYEEKTGGLDNGIIVVSCAPIDAGDGRMTVCYDIPELLIYAKEPKLYT